MKKKSWKGFQSPLADAIEQFLRYKRALHKKYLTEERALQLLDHYLIATAVTTQEQVTSAVVAGFLASRAKLRTRPRSYNHLVGVLRRFFEWSVGQGIFTDSPFRAERRQTTGELKPHILSQQDVKCLLRLAGQLSDGTNARGRGKLYTMMFALLYGLGLRVGEVCRLRVGDVDFNRAVLFVRETKFSKNRLVPMGPRLTASLREFMDTSCTLNDADPVFSFDRRQKRAVNPCTASQVFRQLTKRMGVCAESGERTPRLHDFRHAFAVGTLLRWYREGKNPADQLLVLSTFLGHAQPASTAVYLTVTADLLGEASYRFQAFAAELLKGVAS